MDASPNQIRATVLVGSYAQVVGDGLTIVNAGKMFFGPNPEPVGVAVVMEVPWTATNEQHSCQLRLI